MNLWDKSPVSLGYTFPGWKVKSPRMSQKQSGQASLSPTLLMRFIYIYVSVCICPVCVYHSYTDVCRIQERVLNPWSYRYL